MTVDWLGEEERLTLPQLVNKSMADAETIVSDDELKQRTTRHFNTLLKHYSSRQEKNDERQAIKLMNRLFAATSRSMESEADQQRLALLKSYMSCLIGTSLGADEFLEQENLGEEEGEGEEDEEDEEQHSQHALSWADVAARHESEEQEYQQLRSAHDAERRAVRREHARLRQIAAQHVNQPQEEEADYGCFEPDFLHDLPSDTFCMPIFFPSEKSYHTFISALKSAQETLYVCVFSLTDNTTARALSNAMERGVDVKLISDNGQLDAKGSDVVRLNEDYGIPLKLDNGDAFMHNKFAVIDKRIVITGSFNWSIGARFNNKENVLITNIESVVQAYTEEFEKLWDMF